MLSVTAASFLDRGNEFYRKTVSYALLWCVLSTAVLRLSGKLSARMAAVHNSTGKITKEF